MRKKFIKLSLPILVMLNPTLLAQPFSILDARSMAMGDTGVASAKPGSAGVYNPALLSKNIGDESFHIILPNVGVNVFADQDGLDAFNNIEDEDYFDNISTSLDTLNTASNENDFSSGRSVFAQNTAGLLNSLNDLSERPFRIGANALASISIPNQTFGVSVFANATATVETSPKIASCDTDILGGYVAFIDELEDQQALQGIAAEINADIGNTPEASCGDTSVAPVAIVVLDNNGAPVITNPTELDVNGNGYALESEVMIAGVTVNELGVAMAHTFNFMGKDVSIGITPKLQQVTSYFSRPAISDLDSDDYDLSDELENTEKEDDDFNIDLGFSTAFLHEDSLILGLTVKNLLTHKYITAEDVNGRSMAFKIEPQARVGIAWDAPIGLTLAADVDLTKNKPYFLGEETQFLGAGIEWDIINIVKLRAGMRTNLVDTDDSVITAGVGFNIIAVHFDIAGQYSENNAGVAAQFGLAF